MEKKSTIGVMDIFYKKIKLLDLKCLNLSHNWQRLFMYEYYIRTECFTCHQKIIEKGINDIDIIISSCKNKLINII